MANQDGPTVNKNPNQNPNQAQGNAQCDNQGQNPPHLIHSCLISLLPQEHLKDHN